MTKSVDMGQSCGEKRLRYAELIVTHGLNVQPCQLVNISTEVIHRDFALLVAQQAYQRGAKHVNIDFSDPRLGRTRILQSKNEEDLSFVPSYLSSKYTELVEATAANLKIIGSEYPDILSDLDTKKVNAVRLSIHKAIKHFYDEGIGKSRVHWTVAAAATPQWAEKIFPDKENAEELLWEEIYRATRSDKANCLELWQEHNQALQARAQRLSSLKIEWLHFLGPKTDLRVKLSPKAQFKGGSDKSPLGVEFEPNIPTEEVFTTPDYRATEGHVKTTRPFLINGVLVKDLYLEFSEGRISHFTASQGEDTFREYIKSDNFSDCLGEVALVGIDSPVYQSGIVFQEILFDENAACHIAIGSAYKFCLEGGENMSREELEAIGCNDSTVHTDMMISSEEVDVTAKTYDGQEISLIKSGAWVL